MRTIADIKANIIEACSMGVEMLDKYDLGGEPAIGLDENFPPDLRDNELVLVINTRTYTVKVTHERIPRPSSP